ncbi:12240_t:CDS:2, partial [Racocetra fulgida]
FYGDDELYEHCRSSHEQCHICLRAGLETHGSYVSGQRAKQQARRIEVNFISYGESRFRNRQRNQERQVSEIRSENRSDDNDGGGSTIEEAVQQIRNMNISRSNSSSSGGTNANARVVRPPPGFGVLSHNEVISPPDEPPPPPPQNVQRNRTPNPTVSRVRDDEFPTLSAASRVTSNAGIPPRNYSEKVRGSRSLVTNKSNPTSQQRSTSTGKGKASTSIIQPMQGSSSGSSSKGKELAHMNTEFPALEPSSPPQKT